MRKKSIAILSVFLLLAVLANHAHAASPPSCGLLPSGLAAQISNNEPWYCPINEQMYTQWANDLPLAGVALLISFAIATIIMMVGVALKSDKLRNFGIGELYEALASTIIVGMFLYVAAVMFGIIPALFVGNINPFPTALNLMTSTIQQAQTVYANYFNEYLLLKFIYSISPFIKVTGTSFKISVSSAQLTPFYDIPLEILYISPLSTLGWMLSDGSMALWAEYYILVFFSVAAIPAFLVPGVVLRSIFPTRALGGMLMALAIGFYLVMPTLFAVAYYFTAPGILQQLQTSAAQSTRFMPSSTTLSSITPTSPEVLQLQSTLQNTQSAMSGFWLLILFYPVLITSLTYAFVTQVAQFIGGAAKSGGRLRGFI